MKTSIINASQFVDICEALEDEIITETGSIFVHEGIHPQHGPVVLVTNALSDEDIVMVIKRAA